MKFKHGTRRRALEYEQDWMQRWKDGKTFEKSVENRPADNAYVFYDGPPFITGVPHHGTLLSSIVKDAVPRYWTMKGKRVERRWGWDCHGLPAENFVEKQLNIVDRRQIVAGATAKDSLKFTPELTEQVKEGSKTSTFRYGAKNLAVGDVADFITRYNESKTEHFGYARITGIKEYLLRDLPLDYEGHDSYDSQEARLKTHKGYYGDEVTLESRFTVYDFEYLGENIAKAPLDKDGNELETISLEKYITKARESMVANSESWEGVIDRVGRWVDFKGAYKTMDKNFMESVWWAFKTLYEQGKIYEGEKVLMFDTKFATPVSKNEVTMDNDAYQTVTDPSLYAKFRLNDESKNVDIEYFVHGTTTDNQNHIATGWNDGELSQLGLEQGRELAKQLADKKFDAIFCSDLGRSISSAELNFPGQKIIHDARLRECNYGDLNGKDSDLVIDEDHIDEPYPNGESMRDVEARIRDFCNYLSENYAGKRVAIVAHKVPQFALQVITENKSWNSVISDDWRKRGAWQPGWEYVVRGGAVVLAWTTTPWTLPANLMLAVNAELTYCEVLVAEEKLIIAEEALERVLKDEKNKPLEYEVVRKFPGSELVGKSYEPFDTGSTWPENDKIHKIYAADFVSHESGTGIVHIAPAYGEDDFELAKAQGVAAFHVIDDNGYYFDTNYKGLEVWENNKFIAKDLMERGIGWKIEYIRHEYPFNPRSGQRIMYRAIPSWFFDIQGSKPLMLEQNENINWFPEHLKHGRFAKNIEQAPDWNLSRDRFWATAMPVWKGDKGTVKVVGSYAELKELSGVELEDYHRPWVDDITFEIGDETFTRIEKVLDCWFESGSMPFAQLHYPFENKEKFEANYPADFIVEYIGQVRAWFYYVHVVNTSLAEIGVFGDMQQKNPPERVMDNAISEKAARALTWVVEILDKNQIFYSIGGGAALCLYGSTRKVNDIDISVHGKDFAKILPLVKEFVVAGPKYYANEKWRCDTLSLNYQGQEIDLTDRDTLLMHKKDDSGWISNCKIYEKFPDVIREMGGTKIRVMDPRVLLEYKRELDGENQNFDIKFLEEYIQKQPSDKQKNAYKNVITTGTLAGNDGRKMSKSLGNFTDPNELMDKFSADSLRFLLLSSPLLSGEDFSLQDKDVSDTARKLSMVWNMYDFFTMYAEVDGWEYSDESSAGLFDDSVSKDETTSSATSVSSDALGANGQSVLPRSDGKSESSGTDVADSRSETDAVNAHRNAANILESLTNPLDIWIVSRVHQLTKHLTEYMDEYNIPDAMSAILPFVDDASNWFVRRSRRRFWKSEDDNDKNDAYKTLHYVLLKLSVLLAPFVPFLAEELYHNLTGDEESVHLKDWPTNYKVDQNVIDEMARTRDLINAGLGLRMKKDEHQESIKVRQPLQFASYTGDKLDDYYEQIIAEELNVKEVRWVENLSAYIEEYDEADKVIDEITWIEVSKKLTPELKREGLSREVVRVVQNARKQAGLNVDDRITLQLSTADDELQRAIQEYQSIIEVECLASMGDTDQNTTQATVDGAELNISLNIR